MKNTHKRIVYGLLTVLFIFLIFYIKETYTTRIDGNVIADHWTVAPFMLTLILSAIVSFVHFIFIND